MHNIFVILYFPPHQMKQEIPVHAHYYYIIPALYRNFK